MMLTSSPALQRSVALALLLIACSGSDTAQQQDLPAAGQGGGGGTTPKAGAGGVSGKAGQGTGGLAGASGGAGKVASSGSSGQDGAGQGGAPSGGQAGQGGEPSAGQGGSGGGQAGQGAGQAGQAGTGQAGQGGGAAGGGAGKGGAGGSLSGGQAGQGGMSGSSPAGGQAGQGTAGAGGQAAVRFVALGDTGEGSTEQKTVAAAMAKKCAQSGCDFAVLLGDNFYDNGVNSVDDPQWQTKFEQVYAALDLPFYAVLGNHDYGGNGTGIDAGRAQVQVDYTKKSTRWKMPDKHYHFTAGNAEFFALDTNEQMFSLAGEQKKNVTKWIKDSLATWKIALGHHPILSNGPHGNAGTYEGIPFIPVVSGGGVKSFMEDVICGEVDLYLCGHDHSRQYLQDTCKGTELVVSGAGAKASSLNQKNESRFQALTVGFFYVKIEGTTLTTEFVDDEGATEFTRVLTK